MAVQVVNDDMSPSRYSDKQFIQTQDGDSRAHDHQARGVLMLNARSRQVSSFKDRMREGNGDEVGGKHA